MHELPTHFLRRAWSSPATVQHPWCKADLGALYIYKSNHLPDSTHLSVLGIKPAIQPSRSVLLTAKKTVCTFWECTHWCQVLEYPTAHSDLSRKKVFYFNVSWWKCFLWYYLLASRGIYVLRPEIHSLFLEKHFNTKHLWMQASWKTSFCKHRLYWMLRTSYLRWC